MIGCGAGADYCKACLRSQLAMWKARAEALALDFHSACHLGKRAESALTQAKANSDRWAADLDQAKARIAELRVMNTTLSEDLCSVSNTLKDTDARATAAEAEAKALRERVEELENERESQRETLSRG